METVTDPLLFDGERLRGLASDAIVRRGVAYFKEGRVVELGWDTRRLWAAVAGCTCPDFATNRLGTCKHIEAVVHALQKKGGARRRPAPVSVVYLAWDVADAPRVRVRPAASVAPDLARLLAEHFDDDGFLRGPVEAALQRFRERVSGRDDVHVGDDALGHGGGGRGGSPRPPGRSASAPRSGGPADRSTVLRADALAGAPAVPAALAEQVLRDARTLVARG